MFEFASRHVHPAIQGKECSLGSGNCALYKCGMRLSTLMTGVIMCCQHFGPHGKSVSLRICYYYPLGQLQGSEMAVTGSTWQLLQGRHVHPVTTM